MLIVVAAEEFRRLFLGVEPKRGVAEIGEVRYANPLYVFTMQGDGGRV